MLVLVCKLRRKKYIDNKDIHTQLMWNTENFCSNLWN